MTMEQQSTMKPNLCIIYTYTRRKKKTIELFIQYSIIVKAYSSESAACSGFCAALSCKAS